MDSSNKDKGVWPSDKLPSNWAWAPMDLVFNNETSSDRKLKQKMYLPEGRIAVIDQGQELVGGYTNDDNIAFTGELPVIIFGDHTRCVKYIDFPFAQGADGVKVLSPTSLVDPKFSYNSLLTLSLPDKGYSRHFKFLKETQFPIPPLPEQKRIAKKIDNLQARSSGARKALEAVPSLLEKFRQSVLSSAFRGDLTTDWRAQNPDIEPAEKLLERIRKERRKRWEEDELAKMKAKGKTPKDNKWKDKYKEPEQVDTTELPELPEGWCWARWEELGFCQNGRAFPSKQYSSEGVKLLRPGNLHISGNVEWNDNNTRFMPKEWEEKYPFYIIEANELVINLTAQSLKDEFLGRICLTREGEHCLLNQRIARLTPIILNPKFILFLLKSPYFRQYVDSLNTGTLIQHMFSSQIENFVLPLPPQGEQKVIQAFVDSLLAKIEKIAEQVIKAKEWIEMIDQSILAKAFRGELVPQDPNDEPASVLLERIKQEKASLEAGKKQKGKVGKGKTVIRKKKATAMAKKNERRPLVEVLQPHSSGLSPEELFQQAGFDEHLVDEFYIELKNEVIRGNIIEDRPDQERVLLRLNAA